MFPTMSVPLSPAVVAEITAALSSVESFGPFDREAEAADAGYSMVGPDVDEVVVLEIEGKFWAIPATSLAELVAAPSPLVSLVEVRQRLFRSGFGFHGSSVSDLEVGGLIVPPNELGMPDPESMSGIRDATYYFDAAHPNALEAAVQHACVSVLFRGGGVPTVYLTEALGTTWADLDAGMGSGARLTSRQRILSIVWQGPKLVDPAMIERWQQALLTSA